MQFNKKTRKTKKPLVLGAGLALVALLGALTAFAYANKVGPFSDLSTSDSSDAVNYGGLTDQEKNSSQDAKKREEEQNNGKTDTPSKNEDSSKKIANVGVTYADIYNGNLEVRAFVNNVIEGDGTCTATATLKGKSNKVTATSDAFIDSSSSQCEPIYIPVSKLKSGTWIVAVAYSSPNYVGISDSTEVTIP